MARISLDCSYDRTIPSSQIECEYIDDKNYRALSDARSSLSKHFLNSRNSLILVLKFWNFYIKKLGKRISCFKMCNFQKNFLNYDFRQCLDFVH